MSEIVRFSEAAALALHTAGVLAEFSDRLMSVHDICKLIPASENHLAKVLQRLSHAGLVTSERGPKGGFRLARPLTELTLLEVYEAVEGPLSSHGCMFGTPQCSGNCILGDALQKSRDTLRLHLGAARLSDLPRVFSKGIRHETTDSSN